MKSSAVLSVIKVHNIYQYNKNPNKKSRGDLTDEDKAKRIEQRKPSESHSRDIRTLYQGAILASAGSGRSNCRRG